ncbi:DNA-binding protein [Pseudomonas aeruginosa]|uniref:DNA-binding protein n=1 Tax=Pseudomonas aeruginosa TaxID=287 RepID=UPI00214AE0BD|nr:DNA-binding protein [Pseudomonas aeruginosa]
MSEWFSAQKLAGLPGLPGTVQGINSRAIRDSWQQRKHMGRGGGREYHISSLPEETRAALLNAALGEVPPRWSARRRNWPWSKPTASSWSPTPARGCCTP